jgi:hypothetical protein
LLSRSSVEQKNSQHQQKAEVIVSFLHNKTQIEYDQHKEASPDFRQKTVNVFILSLKTEEEKVKKQ